MRRILIKIAMGSSLIFLTLLLLRFTTFNASPHFKQEDLTGFSCVGFADIPPKNIQQNAFIARVQFSRPANMEPEKEFYGQRITFENNPNLTHIDIGITSNLIARVELWNNDTLKDVKEQGFVGKMTWGNNQWLETSFHTRTLAKYDNTCRIKLSFYEGIGFWGKIAEISYNLTGFRDVTSPKSLSLFAKPLHTATVEQTPDFSNLMIWKGQHSFD